MGGSGIGPVFLCLSCKHRAEMKFTKAGVLSLRYGDQYAPCSVLEMPARIIGWHTIYCLRPCEAQEDSFSSQLVFNQCIMTFIKTFIKPKCNPSEILPLKPAWKAGLFSVSFTYLSIVQAGNRMTRNTHYSLFPVDAPEVFVLL